MGNPVVGSHLQLSGNTPDEQRAERSQLATHADTSLSARNGVSQLPLSLKCVHQG